MYIALSCMFVGILTGRLARSKVRTDLSPLILAVICLLLFVLGLELGFNEELLSKFSHIGITAAVSAVTAVAGSCIAAKLFYSFIMKNES